MPPKLLIIRFSSFGDIVQCYGAADNFRHDHSDSEIHWVIRSDMKELVEILGSVNRTWALWRHEGIKGLIRLGKQLRNENFSHVYDAHSNLRSHILTFIVRWNRWGRIQFLRRSKERINRILLFFLRINRFPKPFKGRESFVDPMTAWNVSPAIRDSKLNFPMHLSERVTEVLRPLPRPIVILAPSAAWKMKRWPVDYWKELVFQCRRMDFVIIGGPTDGFCEELVPGPKEIGPRSVVNLAGKLTLAETAFLVSQAELVVSADTGILHLADAMGRPTIALIGPTAFGHPSSKMSTVLETQLFCRPCSKDGRGGCSNKIYQRCMREISPQQVIQTIELKLQLKPTAQ